MMEFRSDHASIVCPEILGALGQLSSSGFAPYGEDDLTASLGTLFGRVFAKEPLDVFPVLTGTSANALAVAASTRHYGGVFCCNASHLYQNECGAFEFFSHGGRIVPLPGEHGKLTAGVLEDALNEGWKDNIHKSQPTCVSITQPTEHGTLYTQDELHAIATLCQHHGLALHMDGSRLANAVVASDQSLADMTWRSGVDVLSFGATKGGGMLSDAVIFFSPELAQGFRYRQKQSGHLAPKMVYMSLQLEAYLKDDLWLKNARHANAMAKRFDKGVSSVPGVEVVYPVETNALFLSLQAPLREALDETDIKFCDCFDLEYGPVTRWVTAWNTPAEHVDAVVALLASSTS